MRYTIKDNSLTIHIDADEQKELQAMEPDKITSNQAMYDFLEPLICNGLSWVAPEWIGALTAAPILSEGGLQDNGEWDGAPVFWYGNYQLRSPLHDLRDYGKVVFTGE